MTDSKEEDTPRRIVVGVDGSEHAARAARWAAAEAVSRGVPLTLAHALHLPAGAALPMEPVKYAEKRREEGGRLLRLVTDDLHRDFPQLRIDTELSDHSAAHTLCSMSLEAGLVVTGTRGHGGFAGMLLGSVSHKLAAHTHSPLVVVRGERPEEDLVNEDVVGVEPEQSAAAIRYAFAAAQRYGAVLHAVRSWPPTGTHPGPLGTSFADFADIRDEECRIVEHLLSPFRSTFPDVKTEVFAEGGNPVPTLIQAAHDARLLVVGAHRHRGPLSVGAGYTVEGLLAHSPTPVAVVPAH